MQVKDEAGGEVSPACPTQDRLQGQLSAGIQGEARLPVSAPDMFSLLLAPG